MKQAEDTWDFCDDMDCSRIFRDANCDGKCPRFDDRMRMIGSIYAILPDGRSAFVGRLPGQLASRTKTTANNVETAPEYPTGSTTFPPLEQA